jgi:hypothetical protein
MGAIRQWHQHACQGNTALNRGAKYGRSIAIRSMVRGDFLYRKVRAAMKAENNNARIASFDFAALGLHYNDEARLSNRRIFTPQKYDVKSNT